MNYETKKNLISMVGLYIVIVVLFTIWTIYGIKNARDIIPQETTIVRNFRTTETTTGITTTETTTEETSKLQASYKQVKPVEATKTDSNKGYRTMTVIATAYCPCKDCSGGYGWSTATGAVATSGRTIAVDPSVIPYGTKVIINGHTYIAEDCGSAIKGKRIDIFFSSHKEVEAFGRQKLNVYIER